jgi:FtsP/CotA-like multicopper oxidase with cupredoxin domain
MDSLPELGLAPDERRASSATTWVAALTVGIGVLRLAVHGWWPAGVALVAVGFLTSGTKRSMWIPVVLCSGFGILADIGSMTVGIPTRPTAGVSATGIAVLLGGLILLLVAGYHQWRPGPRAMASLVAATVAALLALPVAVNAVPPTTPTKCVTPNRSITLYAEELGGDVNGISRLGYGLSPSTASTPGPLIELMEGDCVAITLVNDVSTATLQRLRDEGKWPADPELPLGLSLHAHGVRYARLSDGTVHSHSYAPPGQSRTYVWYAAPRVATGGRVVSPGSAGYWWYHDHVGGTDHGTGGINAGLWGGIIVRRPSDPLPDRTYVVGMGGPSALINSHRLPESFACDQTGNVPGPDCFVATEGQRVEFLVIGIPGPVSSEDMHEFHLHGHTWADNRTGLLSAPDDDVRVIDAKSVGPSESWGFQVIAGDDVGPGDWMLHCHIQGHADRGMVTFFRVQSVGESVAVPSPGALPHVHGGR